VLHSKAVACCALLGSPACSILCDTPFPFAWAQLLVVTLLSLQFTVPFVIVSSSECGEATTAAAAASACPHTLQAKLSAQLKRAEGCPWVLSCVRTGPHCTGRDQWCAALHTCTAATPSLPCSQQLGARHRLRRDCGAGAAGAWQRAV